MSTAERMSTVSKLRALLTPAQRTRATGLIVLTGIGTVMEMAGVGLVIPVVALITQAEPLSAYPRLRPWMGMVGEWTRPELIVGAMLVLVGINVVRALFLAFLVWRQVKFAFDLQADLSLRLFGIYLHQPYTFQLQRNSAELIRNVITEVGHFTSTAILPAMLLMTEGLVLLGMATLLLIVEPLGAIAVVAVTGLAAGTYHRATRGRLLLWGETRQYHEGLRMQHLQQGLGGAKEVKLLGREEEFLARYREHTLRSARMGQHLMTIVQLPRLWLELLAVAGLATLVLVMLAQGRDTTSVAPALGLFTAAAFRLMPSVNRMLGALQTIRYASPVVNTLYAEVQLASDQPAPARGPAVPFQSRIELSEVSFTYPAAAGPALRDISMVISAGESVGLIGPSGSGKSTLVDVILGLLTPQAGLVRVDGVDIQRDLRSWQDQVGYVPQTIYLTDDTLRRNVAFGLPDDRIDDVAVRRALHDAQLEEFVASLPEGVDTVVGERGVRLSGGQRQRIGVARALYHGPAVLVLDEATSALDAETERGVMQSVAALHGAKTVIVVAHRLSTVEHCDRLYRLDQGRLVAEGRPTDVLPSKRAV